MGETSTKTVYAIEQKTGNRRHLTLQGYIKYADCLGLTLQDVFNTPLPQEAGPGLEQGCGDNGARSSLAHSREDELVDKVQKAIQSLVDSGRPLSQCAVGRQVSMSPQGLKRYPRVKTILDGVKRHCYVERPDSAQCFRLREEALFGKVQKAVKSLKVLEQPVTQSAIGRLVGMTLHGLKRYPRVKVTMEQAVAEYRQRYEDELVDKTLKAVEQLKSRNEPVTQWGVAPMIEISQQSLKKHPRVMAIVEQAVADCCRDNEKRRQMERQLREKRLVAKVQEAIQNLEAEGKPVTQVALGKMVGMSWAGLEQYPQVRVIWEQFATKRCRGNSI